MIKLICRGAKPSQKIFSYMLHSNPRRLLDINRIAKTSTGEDLLNHAAEFSKILQDIRVGGVWKRTSPGRLPLTTQAIINNISVKDELGVILDIGSSDGCTSVDLIHALDANVDQPFRVYMADLYLWLDVWRNGPWVEFRSAQGLPVMAVLARLGMRLPNSEHRWDTFGSWLAKKYLSLKTFRSAFKHQVRIPMVNPLAIAEGEERIFPLEMDCLKYDNTLASRFDGIRASNILNFGYFTSSQLLLILTNFHNYLQEDGILVVSRSEGSVSNEIESGTVWEKTEKGFARKDGFGLGSEIDGLVESFRVG